MILYQFKILSFLLFIIACNADGSENISIPEPDVITENTKHDTDDPAIWINEDDPSKSIVFGTDKDSDGAIYAFDLSGNIIQDKTIKGLKRPNNVDIRYDFAINDSSEVDVLAFTERERGQVRIFSVPDMKPLDGGGFPVFEGEQDPEFQLPMGISFYDSQIEDVLYLIVGRKDGPEENYLHQYKVIPKGEGVSLKLVRKFGKFSGEKEIEAIAVDDELGYVYYSDETQGVRKYYAEPSRGDEEIAFFGGDTFEGDNEGIAILSCEDGEGYIIVSNQDSNSFNIFSRKDNSFIKEISLGTEETDGIEVVNNPLNQTFASGLFVAMNNERNFYYYDLERLELAGPCF